MNKTNVFENYPVGIVILSNLLSLSIYLLGALILAGFGMLVAILFLLYCFWLEFRLLRNSCVNCYYYGKLCFSGRGLLSSLIFKRDNPQKFLRTDISWKDMIPDFLVIIIPLAGGILLSIIHFSWLRLGLMALIIILGFPVTGLIRGNLACVHCKQRELGCPAEKLFSKKQD